jgi:hypothetical protein
MEGAWPTLSEDRISTSTQTPKTLAPKQIFGRHVNPNLGPHQRLGVARATCIQLSQSEYTRWWFLQAFFFGFIGNVQVYDIYGFTITIPAIDFDSYANGPAGMLGKLRPAQELTAVSAPRDVSCLAHRPRRGRRSIISFNSIMWSFISASSWGIVVGICLKSPSSLRRCTT